MHLKIWFDMGTIKINELSVGDWVLIDEVLGSEPARALRVTMAGRSMFKESSGQIYGSLGGDISPLPITPEILEKNGFEKRDNRTWHNAEIGCVIYRVGSKHWDIRLHPETRKYRAVRMGIDNIKYIHQLQHAIRIAGAEKEIEL